MTTIRIKRPPDPLQSEITRRMDAARAVREVRDSARHSRPSVNETLLRRSVRAFSDFVKQLGER